MPPERVEVGWEIAADAAFAGTSCSAERNTRAPSRRIRSTLEVAGSRRAASTSTAFTPAARRARSAGRARLRRWLAATRLRFAFASCQHYEQGCSAPIATWLTKTSIWSSTWATTSTSPRGAAITCASTGREEPTTLDAYRNRHALYKSDADLQARMPRSRGSSPGTITRCTTTTRASARSSSTRPRSSWSAALRPTVRTTSTCRCRAACGRAGQYMRHLHARRPRLARRPARARRPPVPRSHQACPREGRGGATSCPLSCPERHDRRAPCWARRRSAGSTKGWRVERSRWNVIAQQTLMASSTASPARDSALDRRLGRLSGSAGAAALDVRRAARGEPDLIGGDVHSYWVTDLKPTERLGVPRRGDGVRRHLDHLGGAWAGGVRQRGRAESARALRERRPSRLPARRDHSRSGRSRPARDGDHGATRRKLQHARGVCRRRRIFDRGRGLSRATVGATSRRLRSHRLRRNGAAATVSGARIEPHQLPGLRRCLKRGRTLGRGTRCCETSLPRAHPRRCSLGESRYSQRAQSRGKQPISGEFSLAVVAESAGHPLSGDLELRFAAEGALEASTALLLTAGLVLLAIAPERSFASAPGRLESRR